MHSLSIWHCLDTNNFGFICDGETESNMSSRLILFSFLFYNLCNLFCLCGYKLTQFLSFEHQSLENCGITSHCRGWGKNVINQGLQFGPHAQITTCIRHSMCACTCVYACTRTRVCTWVHMQTSYITFTILYCA